MRLHQYFRPTCSILAITYGVGMVFGLHRHEEAWAFVVGLTFAIYQLVPKLPEQPYEIKPEKYTLFG